MAERGSRARIRRKSSPNPETNKHKCAEVATNVACVRRRKVCGARVKGEGRDTGNKIAGIKTKTKQIIHKNK